MHVKVPALHAALRNAAIHATGRMFAHPSRSHACHSLVPTHAIQLIHAVVNPPTFELSRARLDQYSIACRLSLGTPK